MASSLRSSVAVLGVPFDNVTMNEAVELIERHIEARGFHQVVTANLDFIIHALKDKSLQSVLCSCDLVVPDGMPIVWASRLMGSRLKERVSGVDLIPHLAELSCRRGYGIYLLGASEDNSRRAAQRLIERFPKLRIVGRHSPPAAPLEEMDHADILARIELAKPDILLVAMGHPKQEQWLAMNRNRLNVPLCMGIGGSLDMLAGAISRAPIWMQASGLEWFYRAWQEPKRLWKRYWNDAYGLLRHLPGQLAATAIQPRRLAKSRVQTRELENASVISVAGNLTGATLAQVDEYLLDAVQKKHHVILDLANAAYLGPDSLASLLHAAITMKYSNRQLLLAESPDHLLRVLKSAQLRHCFLTVPTVSDAVYRVNRGGSCMPPELATISGALPVAPIHIKVEMLKDFCERILAVGNASHFIFGSQCTTAPTTTQ